MTRSSRRRPATPAVESAQAPVFAGGRYQPLTESECEQIIDSSLDILQGIGIADTPDWLQRLLLENGAGLRQDGRVTFARGAVEKALRRASHRVSLPGFDDNRGLDIGGGHVHIGRSCSYRQRRRRSANAG
jgi:trimethylamine--corrinoid protein Co-methyltransferase